jgi:hypothetical protein
MAARAISWHDSAADATKIAQASCLQSPAGLTDNVTLISVSFFRAGRQRRRLAPLRIENSGGVAREIRAGKSRRR